MQRSRQNLTIRAKRLGFLLRPCGRRLELHCLMEKRMITRDKPEFFRVLFRMLEDAHWH
jgi:hypothetical protein